MEADGNDELGDMGRAFQRMVVSLRGLAANAERIAGGDLFTPIAPASDRDMLGHAFATMARELRGPSAASRPPRPRSRTPRAHAVHRGGRPAAPCKRSPTPRPESRKAPSVRCSPSQERACSPGRSPPRRATALPRPTRPRAEPPRRAPSQPPAPGSLPRPPTPWRPCAPRHARPPRPSGRWGPSRGRSAGSSTLLPPSPSRPTCWR